MQCNRCMGMGNTLYNNNTGSTDVNKIEVTAADKAYVRMLKGELLHEWSLLEYCTHAGWSHHSDEFAVCLRTDWAGVSFSVNVII